MNGQPSSESGDVLGELMILKNQPGSVELGFDPGADIGLFGRRQRAVRRLSEIGKIDAGQGGRSRQSCRADHDQQIAEN